MRRLFVPAIVALVGCSQTNPGFDLVDTRAATASTADETSTPEVTGPPTMPTSTGETTSSVTLTTTSGETSTTSGEPMTTTSEDSSSSGATTGTKPMWETDCYPDGDFHVSGVAVAIADTFLLNEDIVVNEKACTFGSDTTPCRDTNLGATDKFELVFNDGANEAGPDDFASVFAVRFPKPEPVFEEVPVDPSGWLGIRVKVHVAGLVAQDMWKPIAFDVYRFSEGDLWEPGIGEGIVPCLSPGASYRCRTCPMGPDSAMGCLKPWTPKDADSNYRLPFLFGENRALTGVKLSNWPGDGVDVNFDFPIDDWEWLTAEGMLLVPQTGVPQHVVEAKTMEWMTEAKRPTIGVIHCGMKND